MTKDSIVEYIEYIRTYEIQNENNVQMIAKTIESVAFDYDENVDKLKRLMNSWKLSDKKDKENYLNKKNTLIELLKLESEFLIEFGHKYSQMKMNIKHPVSILYNKEVTNTMNANGAYSPSNNSIKYNLSIIQPSSAAVLGTVFHEMRHAKQYEFIRYKDSDILFDPLFINMAKERILRDKNIINYDINHENFLEENDANLYGKYILTELSEKYLNRLYENEVLQNAFDKDEQKNLFNYGDGQLFRNGEDISYNGEENNNRIIDTDKIVKKIIKENPNLLYEYPILRYVYNSDGISKTYEEIIEEKNLLLEKHKDNKILETDAYSYTNYISNSSKTEKEQIETIYSLIISSDPILYLEDCLNKQAYKRIRDMLENNEIIVNEYKEDFIKVLNKYSMDANVMKIINMLGINNLNQNYSSMIDELEQDNNQSVPINNSDNNTEQPDLIDLIPNEINELFVNYAREHYKEIIDYDNLSYDEIYEEEEQIKQGINHKINKEILRLQKVYIEIKKENPNIGYNEFLNYLYPNDELDVTEQIDIVESVDKSTKVR